MLLITFRTIGTLKILRYLDIKALEPKSYKRIYDKLKEDKRQAIDLNFGDTLEMLKGEYLAVYEGVK